MAEHIPESNQAIAALNNQEAPILPEEQEKTSPGDGSESDSDDSSVEEVDSDNEDGRVRDGLSYREILKNAMSITLYLYREDKSQDFLVTYKEVAELLHKRLKVPVGDVISVDTTPYKKIIIEVKGTVRLGSLNLTQSLQLRPGLWTRPLQAPEKDRKINIKWAPMKFSNKEIEKTLSLFGQVTSSVDHVVIWDGPEEWMKALNGVTVAERWCRMKIETNIPSLIVVRGVKLRVDYQGQPKTCSRCYKFWTSCPGDGKADKCKKAGGEEVKLNIAFKKLTKSLKKKGGEKAKDPTTDKLKPTIPDYIPDPDQIRLTGFPEDMKLPAFKEWLDTNKINYLDAMCFQGKKPGSFTIENVELEDGTVSKLDAAEAADIVDKLNGFKLNRRVISVTMAAVSTPEKVRKQPEVVSLDSSEETPEETPAAQLALPAPATPAAPAVNGEEAELPKTPEAMDDDSATDGAGVKAGVEAPIKDPIKLRILSDVTQSGNQIKKVERMVGQKYSRADTSNSSVEVSPELKAPKSRSKKVKGQGHKKN